MEKWSLLPGWVRNIVQRSRSLERVTQDSLSHLRAAAEANSEGARRVSAASFTHRRETRALKVVLEGTLSRLAE